ncbi:MAG: hypothetical protein WC859_10335 [Elusimicrobiota bacterium]|jgi:hypothetical protein
MTGRARTYTKETADKAAQALRSLPPKPPAERPMSTSDTIKMLKPEIVAAIANGYTHQEIVENLKKNGVKVGLSTLKNSLKGMKAKPKAKDKPE